MDFYHLVPASHRKLPHSWRFSDPFLSSYTHTYAELCDVFEIDPVTPLADWKLSNQAKTGPQTSWCEPKYLNRFYTLAVFHLGPLDEDYIWKALPGWLQGRRDNHYVQGIVKGINKLNDKMYTDMITNTIKPITHEINSPMIPENLLMSI